MGPIDKADTVVRPYYFVAGSPKWVNITYTNGSSVLSSTGNPSAFPNLTLYDSQVVGVALNATVSSGSLVIPVAGARSARVYGNGIIDSLMDLTTITTDSTYKCKFFHVRISVNNVSLIAAAMRLFQYGRQGSDQSVNKKGGWVARINKNTNPFPTGSVSVDAHTEDLASPLKTDFGTGQSDPNWPDPLYTTAVLSDATWAAGVSIGFGVDYSVSPWRVICYINGALEGSDAQTAAALPYYPPPGIDNGGTPANSGIAGGFTLFAQSKDDASAILKDATVSPIWFGEARDAAHLSTIFTALHANPAANPY